MLVLTSSATLAGWSSVVTRRKNGAQLRRAPRAVERRAVRGGGQRRQMDRGARARGRAPVVSGPARRPARQDRDGGRSRRHDAQRLLAHHHAAGQGHLAQDGVSGLHARRRLRHGGDGGRRRLPDDCRSHHLPRAAVGAAAPAGCCATSTSPTASRCRSPPATSFAARSQKLADAGFDYMAGLEVEFHVFKLDNPRLQSERCHLAGRGAGGQPDLPGLPVPDREPLRSDGADPRNRAPRDRRARACRCARSRSSSARASASSRSSRSSGSRPPTP